MKLDDLLSNSTSVAFDTSPIIYFVEANPLYDAIVTPVFQKIDDGEIIGITSVISLCEVLVTYEVSVKIAQKAASIRSAYNLRTPDAIQIGTAIENGCSTFLCNDKKLKRVTEMNVVLLSDLTD